MTPQEEQALVKIIVQCVRAVLEISNTEVRHDIPGRHDEKGNNQPSLTSRFISVVPDEETYRSPAATGQQDERSLRPPGRGREEVREALRRFLRNSEQLLLDGKAGGTAMPSNGRSSNVSNFAVSGERERDTGTGGQGAADSDEPGRQKRQLITQADILAAYRQGQKVIALQQDAIVTPLARQVAKDKGVELR